MIWPRGGKGRGISPSQHRRNIEEDVSVGIAALEVLREASHAGGFEPLAAGRTRGI